MFIFIGSLFISIYLANAMDGICIGKVIRPTRTITRATMVPIKKQYGDITVAKTLMCSLPMFCALSLLGKSMPSSTIEPVHTTELDQNGINQVALLLSGLSTSENKQLDITNSVPLIANVIFIEHRMNPIINYGYNGSHAIFSATYGDVENGTEMDSLTYPLCSFICLPFIYGNNLNLCPLITSSPDILVAVGKDFYYGISTEDLQTTQEAGTLWTPRITYVVSKHSVLQPQQTTKDVTESEKARYFVSLATPWGIVYTRGSDIKVWIVGQQPDPNCNPLAICFLAASNNEVIMVEDRDGHGMALTRVADTFKYLDLLSMENDGERSADSLVSQLQDLLSKQFNDSGLYGDLREGCKYLVKTIKRYYKVIFLIVLIIALIIILCVLAPYARICERVCRCCRCCGN